MYDVLSFKSFANEITDYTYTDYFYRLMLIARSIFKWNNLPNGLDEKWIERYLFTEGKCVFYKDQTKGFIVAKCADGGSLNYYDEPTKITPVATNMESTNKLNNHVDCVVIRNNDIMIPTAPTIQLFAYRLADISRTIDVNIHAQKTPIMILCSDRQKNSMMQLYKKYKGFEPIIYGAKDLDIEGINVLKTDAPIVFDKLQIQKHAIWNEAMTFLGINNANQDKRERLVDDEVQANNEQVEISAHCMLKAREQACEEINKLFGTNISVEMRIDEYRQSYMSEEDGEEDV